MADETQAYPKALYTREGACKVAKSAAAHEALAKDGWLTADEIDALGAAPAEPAAESPSDDPTPKPKGRKPKAE